MAAVAETREAVALSGPASKPAPRRVFMLSTAVAPLGSGLGGGVEAAVAGAARELRSLGYHVRVLAPAGSVCEGLELELVPGRLAPTAVGRPYDDPVVLEGDSFLVAALGRLAEELRLGDVVISFSYDWLPLFMSGRLPFPLGTILSMGSMNRSLDREVRRLADRRRELLAFVSRAQAASFGIAGPVRCIPPGLDLPRYSYNAQPDQELCWMGRVAPEKGLEDTFALASRTGISVTVFGAQQDPGYWNGLVDRFPGAPVRYAGFVAARTLGLELGRFRGLLMTPKWLEAFGVVGIEALACGTPVVAYRRGGMEDYVRDGETGWLVRSDDLDALEAAVGRLGEIDRARCRSWAACHHTLEHYGAALRDWVEALAAATAC